METEQLLTADTLTQETSTQTTTNGSSNGNVGNYDKNLVNGGRSNNGGSNHGHNTNNKRQNGKSMFLLLAIIIVVGIAFLLKGEWLATRNAVLIQLFGLISVAFIFWLTKQIFASGWFNPKRKMIAHGDGDPPPDCVRERGFLDFFVGDDGRYSMVRLQVVAWAFTIISYQISVLIALKINSSAGLMDFKPVFTEEVLWLLGLSLGSYVSIKGITAANADVAPAERATPKLADFVTSNNGLDFSKFQVLIWTIIALVTFTAQGIPFIDAARNYDQRAAISRLFELPKDVLVVDGQVQANELESAANTNSAQPPVPFPSLPWSFVVLMGLSQGAFVGKRLVPTFKISEAKEKRKHEISKMKLQIQTSIKLIEDKIKSGDTSAQKDLLNAQQQLAEYERELNELNSIT